MKEPKNKFVGLLVSLFILIIVSVTIYIMCTSMKNETIEIPEPVRIMDTDNTEEEVQKEEIQKEKVQKEEINILQQIKLENSASQEADNGLISLKNLCIENHPLLKDIPFPCVTINRIKEFHQNENVASATYGGNEANRLFWHFLHYKGITYVLVGQDKPDNNMPPHYAILTDDIYSYSGGIKVGMTKEELFALKDINFTEEPKTKETQAPGYDHIFKFLDKEIDYDSYAYVQGTVTEEELKTYEYDLSTSIGIIVLLKDDKVCGVLNALPTAG